MIYSLYECKDCKGSKAQIIPTLNFSVYIINQKMIWLCRDEI